MDEQDPRRDLVVVVEDDKSIAEFLTLAIDDFTGWRALVAGDGETALELIRHEKPAGVLLDIMLPRRDGLSVFDELRSEEETADIPVVFMSAIDDFRRELRKRGAQHFLEKPFAIDELFSVLDEAMGEQEQAA